MLIHVTQEDLDTGKRCNFYECPIALAVNRQISRAQANMSGLHLFFTWKGQRQCVNSSLELRSKISDIDQAKPIEPFTFELELPC